MIRTRILIGAGGVAFLLWMFTSASGGDQGWSTRADHAFDQFMLGDRALQRDLLSARAGILRDYDPLNRDTSITSASTRELVSLAAADPPLLKATQALASATQAREDLVERFKTDNALLQNSLARFSSLDAAAMRSPAATRLSASMLELSLNTGPDAVAAASRSLAAFERTLRSDSPDLQLRTNGAMLIRLLPEVDGILAESRASPVERDTAQVRGLLADHEARDQAKRLRKRILFATGLMLSMGLLAILAFSLYARDRDLRRRAENERLSATVSNLLIGAQSHDLAEHIERALKQLALHTGADRAYLIAGAAPEKLFTWALSRPAPPDWPAHVVRLATQNPGWRDHLLHVSRAKDSKDPLASALSQAGVASLLLIRASTLDSEEMLLGFETFDASFEVRSDTAAGLLAALAAIRETIQRDRLEADRIRLERRLARARRMETIGAVASGVAHNFNNIIGAISGFSEMAELHLPAGSRATTDLGEIRLAVGRARNLVDQILGFGRRSQSDDQWIHLADLLAETGRMLEASLPSGLRLVVHLDPTAGDVRGDAVHLQQVVMNICHNAAHAQNGHGVVTVSLERSELSRPLVLSHGPIDPGVYGVITVEDEGGGVAPDVLPRLFEPFFTTRRGGTGLGLSTAWEVVQDYGGTIDVRNRDGRGATFTIWLPVSQRPSQQPAAASPHEDVYGNGEAVRLIALDRERLSDDEELIATLGYEVSILTGDHDKPGALRPEEAFDVLVIGGGARSAVEALARLFHDRNPDTPIILGYGDEPPVDRVTGRAVGYPFQKKELANALAMALADRRTPTRASPADASGILPDGHLDVT
ncbi:MAG: DAHL domain-containing protein [Caulobacteraceae bacterium]